MDQKKKVFSSPARAYRKSSSLASALIPVPWAEPASQVKPTSIALRPGRSGNGHGRGLQYAVAPTWGDGHHTGFYTFTTLREMCPCDECTAERAATGRPSLGSAAHASHEVGGTR